MDPTTTPAAPVLWCFGGPWHGRRIVRPEGAVAFEVAMFGFDGRGVLYRYRFTAQRPEAGSHGAIYPDAHRLDLCDPRRSWVFDGHRPGLSEDRDVRYLFPEEAKA